MVQFKFQSIRNRYNLLIQIFPFVSFLLLGFLFGCVYAWLVSNDFRPYLEAAVIQKTSLLGALSVHAVPLFLSVLIVRSRRFRLLYLLAAIKAFLFSFCVCAVGYCFGSAGWLVRWLFLFSDSFIFIVFSWLWLRCFSRRATAFKYDLIVCVAVFAVVVFFDYFVISPFLFSVFNYL